MSLWLSPFFKGDTESLEWFIRYIQYKDQIMGSHPKHHCSFLCIQSMHVNARSDLASSVNLKSFLVRPLPTIPVQCWFLLHFAHLFPVFFRAFFFLRGNSGACAEHYTTLHECFSLSHHRKNPADRQVLYCWIELVPPFSWGTKIYQRVSFINLVVLEVVFSAMHLIFSRT